VGSDTKPGLLRFHGGYPKNEDWKDEDRLVDVVHPQENWQVKNPGGHSAFIQISLYQPLLMFGISSQKSLDDTEWEIIWEIWEKALGRGIGSRVSAGYGQPKIHPENSLLTVHLKGQGLASQLINKEGEFRANMFKAALRGHTLRLLGGVTTDSTAEQLTKSLWGGFADANGSIVGKLGIAFQALDLELDDFTYTPNSNPFNMPIYDLKKGQLDILVMGNLSEEERTEHEKLATQLIKFSLLLGGFGKSWRRIDHRMFFDDYLENGNKPMIGCHWEFIPPSIKLYCPVQELTDITKFLDNLHTRIKNWVRQTQGKQLSPQGANWREAWHPNKVQVWGRIAEDKLDSMAVEWFHGNYSGSKTIKQSDLTGKMGRIGRIWHRMYPRYIVVENKIKRVPNEYIELLTIFPDSSQKTQDFLQFLAQSSDFEKLWGGS
jgi:CRISPR-associated protein Cmr6